MNLKYELNTTLIIMLSCMMISCNYNNNETVVASASMSRTLVWEDNFNTDGLPDTKKWSFDIGDGCPKLCGWGNNELQYYTDADSKNARVENGNLIIEAHKNSEQSRDYSSARLVTKNKGDWKYGTIEIRAKLPQGKGTWPAIWMLPTVSNYGGWPASGEIDIMEHVGYAPDSIFGTVHTTAFNHMIGTQVGSQILISDAETAFKTYAIDWNENEITWSIDGIQYHSFKNENKTTKEWPFDQPFHLILNIAVGGNWGGKYGVDETIWPQRMEIDWVKVWK